MPLLNRRLPWRTIITLVIEGAVVIGTVVAILVTAAR